MVGLGTTVVQSQAVISLRAYLRPQGATQQALLNYASPNTLVASAGATLFVTIPANTLNSPVALATLFAAYTAPIFVSISDATNPGLGFLLTTASNASGKIGVGAGLSWLYQGNGTTALPTVYIDNTDLTTALTLAISVMTQ